MLDHVLSFGVGRPTTFPLRHVTRRLPSESNTPTTDGTPSAFPCAAGLMWLFAPLINGLNGEGNVGEIEARQIIDAKAAAMEAYSRLPPSATWSVEK